MNLKISKTSSTIRVIYAMALKDIKSSLTERAFMLTSIIIPINFLLLFLLFALTGGQAPTAVVLKDNGPYAQQLLSAMEHSHSFIIQQTTASKAQKLMQLGRIVAIVIVAANFDSALKNGNKVELPVVIKVAAVITIPRNFDSALDSHKPDPVTIHINNLNLDFTNDLRRSLPAAITEFYSNGSNMADTNNPIHIHIQETDLRSQDVDLLRFEILPILVLLLTTSGIVNAGLATAREWEDFTIKELLLAPISKMTLIVGKLLSGWLTTLFIAAIVLVIGATSGYLKPEGPTYWISTVVIVLLIALASAGLGVAIGATARRFQRVTSIGIPISIDLFFLSGGITVAAFLPVWLQTIAHFVPTFYGTHALEMAIFYSSTEGLALDLSVLAATAIVAVTLGMLSLRRSMFA